MQEPTKNRARRCRCAYLLALAEVMVTNKRVEMSE